MVREDLLMGYALLTPTELLLYSDSRNLSGKAFVK